MTQKTKLEIIGPYTPEHEGPFCTRDGKRARIICTDRKSKATPKCMIVALVDDGDQELNLAFEKDGRHCTGGTNYDLMNAREVPVAREFWMAFSTSGGRWRMTQPTGVFVRLHDGALNEEQIAKLCTPKRTMTESLFAIGTPVTGGELGCEAVLQYLAEARSLRVVSWNAKPFPDKADVQVTPLADALAKLAGKDAEIARLRDALNDLVKSSKKVNARGASTGPQWIAFGGSIIHAEYTLKGPAV